jgi:hypothetical protein
MSQTLQLRAVLATDGKSLKREASPFKIAQDVQPRTRTIAPDSANWQELQISKRLAGVPLLESLIRTGRARLVFCETATSTCDEKAAAAGIHPDEVVKTIYAKEVFGDEKYLIVATGTRRIRLGGVLADAVDGSSVGMSEGTPAGMVHGTCTPFVSAEVAGSLTLIGVESPYAKRMGKKGRVLGKLGEMEADISIGGTDSIAHHLSVRMGYADFVSALQEEYGPKVVLLDGIERM